MPLTEQSFDEFSVNESETDVLNFLGHTHQFKKKKMNGKSAQGSNCLGFSQTPNT